jgi:FAD/FMN-containing dehydrogenase
MTIVASPGLERRLKSEAAGEILFDAFSRGRYATDASSYQMVPLGVVVPRTTEEAERAIAVARADLTRINDILMNVMEAEQRMRRGR